LPGRCGPAVDEHLAGGDQLIRFPSRGNARLG
jgi:hypothetical protein